MGDFLDGILIETVGSYTHQRTNSPSTKLEVVPEGIFYLLRMFFHEQESILAIGRVVTISKDLLKISLSCRRKIFEIGQIIFHSVSTSVRRIDERSNSKPRSRENTTS